MHPILFLSARISLAFLWLATAYASVWGDYSFGVNVLSSKGITGVYADICIIGGAALDALLGLWLLLASTISGWRLKECFLVQGIAILVYTGLLTIIDSSFWNHPFGPLTKNIPLLFLIAILYQETIRKVRLKNR